MKNLKYLYTENDYIVVNSSIPIEEINSNDVSTARALNTNKVLVLTDNPIDVFIDLKNKTLLSNIGKIIVAKKNDCTSVKEIVLPPNYNHSIPSEQEYLQLLEKTCLLEQSDRLSFLGKNQTNNLIDTLSLNFSLRKIFRISNASNPVCLCILSSMDIFNATSNLVSWIWIDPSIESQDRNIIHQAIQTWLDNESIHPKTYASINIENTRSLKFFKKLGFKSEGVSLKI